MWPDSPLVSSDVRQARRRAGSRPRLALGLLEDRSLPSFLAPVPYAVAGYSPTAATGHFNNDTILDLVTANSSTGALSVLLGNGDGTFQPAVNSPTGATPQSIAVGDFDADGKMDVATANTWDVSILRGNGDGTFQVPTSIGIGAETKSVAVGDFNADGKLDLGVTSNTYIPGGGGYYGWYPGYYVGQASVLLGTGTGSFGFAGTWWLASGFHSGAVAEDFNGDGRDDFAAAAPDLGSVAVLLADSAGALQAPTYFGTAWAPSTVTAGDVSGDGKADLVASSQYSDTVIVMLGNGTGGFGAAQTYSAGGSNSGVALGDFNGDNRPDIASATAGGLTVLLGLGNGTFLPPVSSGPSAYPTAVVASDFNGDGRLDAATAEPSASAISVYRNDGVWPALNAPTLTVTDVTVTEGNTGTTNANFTVRLSAAYNQTVTVRYATADSGATAGSDYQSTSGLLTFAQGQTEMTVSVPVIGDRVGEHTEAFLLRLSDATNAFVADGFGMGTILNDEPSISISGFSGPEGNTGTTAFNFTVLLSNAYDEPVTVEYSTANLTPDEEYWYGPAATAGVDYQARTGTVTFAPGDTSETIEIPVIGDRLGEYDELFLVNLANPSGASLSGSQAFGTIQNDEPYLYMSGGTVTEGNSGTRDLTFTVSLSGPTDEPVTASFATADGSATAGQDYVATSGTVTIARGETTQTFTVPVNGDRVGEYEEYFVVILSAVNGAQVGSDTGYGTIYDDEPRINVNVVSLREGNSGTKQMTFTVRLSMAYDQPVTVRYATADGSARAGEDYVAKSGTLTFATGQTTKTFSVTIKGDKKKEDDEYFDIILSSPSPNASIDYNGWGWIEDDDRRGNR